MRIGLFGGTFDPPHLGHLILAEAARRECGLHRVIFLPTGRPFYKPTPRASAQDRLAMVKRAVAGHRAFAVSDWDARQSGPAYTADALAHFKARYPQSALYFLLGSDSFRHLPNWKTGTALLRACTFLVAERPGAPWNKIPAALKRRARKLPCPVIGISSAALRRDIAAGRSVRYRVPFAVESFIRRRRLYTT